ncbi:MAG: hypothetical protein K2Z81_08025, partial [Cyanobacteria bacterium]|nr:hypothetical protein [Cyanobacteriota bacterium]
EEAFKKIQKALTTGKWPGIGADGTPTEVNLTPEKRLDCHRAVVGDMEMMAIQVEARLMVADIFRQSGHFSDAENWLLEARQLADELPLSDIAKESKQLDNQEQTYHYSDGNRRIPFLSAGLGLRGGFWPGDMKAVTDYDNQELPTTLAELKKLKARPIEESQRAFIKRNIVKEAMESNPRPDGIINLPVTVRAQLVGLYLTTPSGQTHPFKPLDAFNTALEARNKFALNRTLLNDGELDPNHELIDHPAVILAFQAVNEVFSNPEKYGLGASGLPAPRISSIEQWSKDYLRRAGKR